MVINWPKVIEGFLSSGGIILTGIIIFLLQSKYKAYQEEREKNIISLVDLERSLLEILNDLPSYTKIVTEIRNTGNDGMWMYIELSELTFEMETFQNLLDIDLLNNAVGIYRQVKITNAMIRNLKTLYESIHKIAIDKMDNKEDPIAYFSSSAKGTVKILTKAFDDILNSLDELVITSTVVVADVQLILEKHNNISNKRPKISIKNLTTPEREQAISRIIKEVKSEEGPVGLSTKKMEDYAISEYGSSENG